jgi:hypothetical protein
MGTGTGTGKSALQVAPVRGTSPAWGDSLMRRLLAVALFSTALFGSSCIWFFAPTSLDGFVEALIRADCHFAFACCTPPERASFFPLNFKDEGACVEESLEQGSAANSVVDRAKAVIAAGKGEFQQDRADECLKPLLDAKNQCDSQAVLAPEPQDPVCAAEAARGFVKGNVDDGDDCDDDIECADFGFCDRVTDAEEDTLTGRGVRRRPGQRLLLLPRHAVHGQRRRQLHLRRARAPRQR